MMGKIKWEVSPAPTGPYKSFHWRGWPVGRTECGMTLMIGCEDDYVPKRVRAGDHRPLKLKFRDDTVPGSPVRVFKRNFETIAELKDFAANVSFIALREVAR
jgi:hypothetical protein